MEQTKCIYNAIRRTGSKTIITDCRNCRNGDSTIFDERCRKNIFKILQSEHGVTQLLMNHAFVKVFRGEELKILIDLTRFIEGLETYQHINLPEENLEECKKCNDERYNEIKKIIETSKSDPINSFLNLKNLSEKNDKKKNECKKCIQEFNNLLSEMMQKCDLKQYFTDEKIDTNVFYTNYIRPYVRPGFVDSFIQLEPPADAVFLESYEIKGRDRRPMNISLYMLKNRPEKLYFVSPSEYDLPRDEIYLLERVRDHLSKHRPVDTSFMDAEGAREYFRHFARQVLSGMLEDYGMNLSATRIEYLSDVFSRYTAGLGILEDLLLDTRVQDVYVNAPVIANPLHIVVDGEEYTSNIFLSNADIDALASRFRTLSGRAFSEASPTLDMDLESYHTRVAAISNPLTPKGIAFAFRRHRQKPWTLTSFIENKMISPLAAGFLSFLVDGQASLLIAGSRGAGKTSLLGSLILEIPQRFRILTIEDTAEVPVDDLQNLNYKIQSLITKSISSGAASTEVSPSDALRTALRLGESVLILGEVRGVEAKVLFEAMRVGAAGNLIMGTIHGSTTRDVYERVVYDIGVPATSFKAVDAVVIAAPIRIEGGIERRRRVIQISEITKTGWSSQPDPDKVFQDVMFYDASKDELSSTDLLDMGQSQILRDIALKWGMTVEKALQNIRLRAEIKKTIVECSSEKPELLEANANVDANNTFWMFIEQSKAKTGKVDYKVVEKNWKKWFKNYVGN